MTNTPVRPSVKERPLSPHIQTYAFPFTMWTSGLHRISGAALTGGTVLLAIWLICLAMGEHSYDWAQALLASLLGRLVMLGFTWALIYHLLNGIRHLVWDIGVGFELQTARRSGYLVVGLSVILTLVVWYFGYSVRGGI
jgi:succinate dehydrogenase / fumarate reductase cytochrome b subunit